MVFSPQRIPRSREGVIILVGICPKKQIKKSEEIERQREHLAIAVEALKEIAEWSQGFYDNRDNQEAENLQEKAAEALKKMGVG